ncbi:CPBP family intramembrane glutamic endopeptidase [Carnobacterium gallinarum]|uniref:CPBP family intramembrane glutamic endopeptidase n=1 Tax=Carnobacterium gallinarum TaxID=2749 RepID=UPI000AAC1984|nr:type II CAAX endopeptidase family protein [Carnobacterium gallinarum]
MKKITVHTSLMILITYLAAQFVPIFIALMAPKNLRAEFSIYGSLICFALGAIIMLLLNRKSTIRNSLTLQESIPVSKVIIWGIAGFFLAIFAQQVAMMIEVNLFNFSTNSQNTIGILTIIRKYPLYLVATSIFGPIMEEFVFRKVIFGFFYDLTGAIGAAVISSLLFAFIHMDGHILLYSAMGFVFCYLYTKTKNIATPMIAHILMNSTAVLASLFFN